MSDKCKEIGEILAAARREQNKTLKDASESTKIMEHYLTAIEAGEPEKLPSLAYFQLFARSYAQFLGLDPMIFEEIEDKGTPASKATTNHKAASAPDPETIEETSRAQAKKFGRSLIYLVSFILVVFVAFVLYNMFFIKSGNQLELTQTEHGVIEGGEMAENNESQSAPLIIPETPYKAPEKLKLRMNVKQDVWALVICDGDTVLNRRLLGGDVRVWEANYRYLLNLGISTAVDLYINDQKLAPLSDQARTLTGIEINQVNFKDFLPVAEDSTGLTGPETAGAGSGVTTDGD